VIDEAHQLPEIAANFLGFAVSSRQLQALSRDAAAELLLSGARQELPATFAQTLERHLFDLQDTLRGPRERTEFKEWPSSVIESIERLQGLLEEFVSSLTEAAKDHAGLATLRRRGAELAVRLRMLVAADEGEEASVRWAQATTHGIRCITFPSTWPSNSAPRRIARERMDLHVRDTRGWRQLRSLPEPPRHARSHDGALRQSIQL
jgi:ATP-dependent DNA helicase DinG